MDPRDKWRLRNNRVALLDIDTGEICPYLIQEGVLTPEDAERIGSKETSKDKTEALLNMLESKGSRAFQVFKDAIKSEIKREDLTKKLDNTDMSKMPARLRKEMKEMEDEDSDSADDGNVIITTTTTSQKRKKPVEGEEHEFKQKKKLFIGVKGNNNVVMSGNTITYNNTSRGSSK
ncbi:hypothetical protein BSL78_26600 [Apostichopus japonicus]|uniref:CARD domain-containing protein n=1 Tax=Stichopus japonicus TaxID=307972 RepID=A0A2G8JLD2_STIJA|nr:hypothetical protein BSL78_26600 [Apostichopus japonicus]